MIRLFVCLAAAVLAATPLRAEPGAALAPVSPIRSCESLAAIALDKNVGAAVSLQAKVVETPKGRFCQASGTIAPSIGFEVDLPMDRWTQRFLQAGCGGLCGSINASIGNAQACRPALDGEFAVAASDLGHTGGMGPGAGDFADDPQKRIDFAYRANHLTALAAKALISAFYGQAPRWSYFSGCSDGGREALMEAQRYPEDFDGVSAGAPALLFQIQNSFFHAWTIAANTGADGGPILLGNKLPILHEAAIAHCDRLDGEADGLLSDPRACKPERDWVACAPGADPSKCLTDAEWAVAEKFYRGPVDASQKPFLPGGLQPGSELQWGGIVPRAPGAPSFARMMAENMAKVVLADAGATDRDPAHYPFTPMQLERVLKLHALNDASNPDLQKFAARGGKLIQWHGWSDSSIAPMISIAYYDAMRRKLGAAETEKFIRLYMLPGVGHCGGGDGFAQFDTLAALMNWVETGAAPGVLRAEKIADRPMMMGPPPGPSTGETPPGPPKSMPAGADGRGGGFARRQPYALALENVLASRDIAPFSGDAALPDWRGADWLTPGFQRDFGVERGELRAAP